MQSRPQSAATLYAPGTETRPSALIPRPFLWPSALIPRPYDAYDLQARRQRPRDPPFRVHSVRCIRGVSAVEVAETGLDARPGGGMGCADRVRGVVLSVDALGEPDAAAGRGGRVPLRGCAA